METHTFFLTLLIILLAARLLAELAARLQVPSVLGELLAGIVLGPSLLGWIAPLDAIRLMAEIGIILLLFEVGLETDVKRLVRSGGQSLVVALTGFFVPLLLGYAISHWLFDQGELVALFVGGTLTATSIGVTVRVLGNLRRQHSVEGQIVLGAAVLDDVMGVVLLAFLYEFTIAAELAVSNAARVLLFVAVFFALAPLIAKLMSVVIQRFEKISTIPGLIPTTIVSLVLFFAWLAHEVGAPEMLGGFAAGLALSRRFFLPLGVAMLHADERFSAHVEHQMTPIINLFTPIFFVYVGLSINFREIDWGSSFIWTFSAAMIVVAVVGKLAGAFLIRESWPLRWVIGMAMIPRGEVGLIFAELGRSSGVFSNEVHAALVVVIAVMTLLPPLMMKWFYNRYGHRLPAA